MFDENNRHSSSCGQPTFKISERVGRLAEELYKEPYMKKHFKEYYSNRSKYLHLGVRLTTQSYTGVSIPQLNVNDPSGCEIQSIPHSINMREYVSYCLRKVLQHKITF